MSGRRFWALSALVLLAAAVVLAVALGITRFPRGLTVLACVAGAIVVAWYGVRRRGIRRHIAGATTALLLAGGVALVILEGSIVANAIVLLAAIASALAARRAFRARVHHARAEPPSHPVLFYNPLSGGGKAERFHLADEARRRGIEPVELRRGEDLEQLVRAAVERGADGLAMAGGDGSQAVVARIAAELDLPYACIPAGTRNHFALDLGVDRNDVVGALDAFVDGGERRVDLAEVNGRLFVNNVSLGLYAEAVQKPGYREAKLSTLLDTVPDALGPDARPATLGWTGPAGREPAVAILVSNNSYRLGHALASGTRPRLDRGELGIAVLSPVGGRGNGAGRSHLAMRQWSEDRIQIDADQRIPAGIDGEAAILDPPLRFRTLPGVLRVRIAPGHPGTSPSALVPESTLETIVALAKFAFGPPQRDGAGVAAQPTSIR